MRKLTLAISAAALMAGAAAFAGGHGMMRDGDMTRAATQTHAEQKFAKMDTNGDGQLNDADREARHTKYFDTLDSNHDGAISRDEFMVAHAGKHGAEGRHHGMGMGMRGHGKMMKEMADTNKDGAVSAAEFTAACLGMFDKADANKDGTVTSAERRAAMKAMHAMKGMPGMGYNRHPDTPAAK